MKKFLSYAYLIAFGIGLLIAVGFIVGVNLNIVVTFMTVMGAVSLLLLLSFLAKLAVEYIWGDE